MQHCEEKNERRTVYINDNELLWVCWHNSCGEQENIISFEYILKPSCSNNKTTGQATGSSRNKHELYVGIQRFLDRRNTAIGA